MAEHLVSFLTDHPAPFFVWPQPERATRVASPSFEPHHKVEVSTSFPAKKPTFRLLLSAAHTHRQTLRGVRSKPYFRVVPNDSNRVADAVPELRETVAELVRTGRLPAEDLVLPKPRSTVAVLNEYQLEHEWASHYAQLSRGVLDVLAPGKYMTVQLPVRTLVGPDQSNLRLDVSVGRKPEACLAAEQRLSGVDAGSSADPSAGPDNVDCSVEFKTEAVLGDDIFDALDDFHAGGGVAYVFKSGHELGVVIARWPPPMLANFRELIYPLALGLLNVVDSATLSVALETGLQIRSNGNRHVSAWFEDDSREIQWSRSTGRRRNGTPVGGVGYPLFTLLLSGLDRDATTAPSPSFLPNLSEGPVSHSPCPVLTAARGSGRRAAPRTVQRRNGASHTVHTSSRRVGRLVRGLAGPEPNAPLQ